MQALRAPAAAAAASTSGRLASPLVAAPRRVAAAPLRAAAQQSAPPSSSSTSSSSSEGSKTVLVKTSGKGEEMPFPWSEKDPYKLPVSIERVQRLLLASGWEKPWVDQIVDRVMKGTLKTTEERAKGVVDYLRSIGLQQDEICNMASVSVVLLGLNPQTRLAPVVSYLERRGVPRNVVPELLLAHPRIFEYRVTDESASAVSKGAARIQVDAVPAALMRAANSGGKKAAAEAAAAVAAGTAGDDPPAIAVNYYREGASFLQSPVSPAPPMPSASK